MGNDLSSGNDFLKKLNQTVMNDAWLNNMYGVDRTKQQNELKKIFTVVASNDVTGSDRNALMSRREVLQDKVERLEAKMAVLQEELAKNQAEIAKHANEITNLITAVEDKSEALEAQQKRTIKCAIEDVFYEYEKGLVGKDAVAGEIKRRIHDNSSLSSSAKVIEKLLGKLDAKEGEVQALVDGATKWIDQKNLLDSQYGVTKSTYDLINGNLSKIGNTETNYTNSDYDKSIPIFSLEKTDIVSDLFENPKLNVKPGRNGNFVPNSTKPSIDSINKKYAENLNKEKTGNDSYTYDNKAVQGLDKAIQNGLFEDLNSAGIFGKDLTDFFVKNFGNANIKYSDDGKIQIPYGHDAKSSAVFKKLTDFLTSNQLPNDTSKWNKDSFKGALNTWDEMQGNTIDSNKQIKALSENFAQVIDKMNSEEPKFTFKEAMYSLFNPETGLFKESGVVYNPAKQGKTPGYFIELAGDDKTAEMYKDLAIKIYDTWGIKPTRGADVENYEDKANNNAPTVEKTDPIAFRIDNKEYSFIIDRNGDNAFSGKEDFVGGTKGASWVDDLKSLDTNNDNVLNGDELANLKILGSQYTDNAKTTYTDGKYLNEQTTNIQYELTDAQKMGIDEIKLDGLTANQSRNVNDINGSELFNDKLNFTLNGKDITAHRKDDTDEFMNAVYKDAYGKNFEIGMTDGEVSHIINKDYGEFDKFNSSYADVFTNINILKGVGTAAEETRGLYDKTLDRIQKEETAQLLRASNKAAALSNVSSWRNIQHDVAEIAARDGIVIDMEQAKGIYITDGSLSARAIVDSYKNMVANEESIANEKNATKLAWSAIILCAKNGVKPDADKIVELLETKQAKTPEEAVEILSKLQNNGVKITKTDLGFDSAREEEIYNEFNKAFDGANLKDKTVDALAELCVMQQNDRSFMEGKTGAELAQRLLKKYQK